MCKSFDRKKKCSQVYEKILHDKYTMISKKFHNDPKSSIEPIFFNLKFVKPLLLRYSFNFHYRKNEILKKNHKLLGYMATKI